MEDSEGGREQIADTGVSSYSNGWDAAGTGDASRQRKGAGGRAQPPRSEMVWLSVAARPVAGGRSQKIGRSKGGV